MKIKMIKLTMLLSVLLIMIVSCDPSKKYLREEKEQIQDYLAGLGDTTYVTKPSGLIVIDLVEGTGILPELYDTVSIRYKGSFIDGRVFASNFTETEPITFIAGTGDLMDGYNRLIEGLSEGVLYTKLDGKTRFVTPSALAYGSRGAGLIPAYTPLRWEIELVEIRTAKK